MSYFSQVINKSFFLQQVIDGKAFFGSHEFTGVATAADVEALLQIGATQCFAVIDIVADGVFSGSLFEGPTNSATGTAVTLNDLNRATANSALSSLFHTPTITADGTLLEAEQVFAAGTLEFSADRSQSMLWLLNSNTDYLIRGTNESGANEDILITVGLIQLD